MPSPLMAAVLDCLWACASSLTRIPPRQNQGFQARCTRCNSVPALCTPAWPRSRQRRRLVAECVAWTHALRVAGLMAVANSTSSRIQVLASRLNIERRMCHLPYGSAGTDRLEWSPGSLGARRHVAPSYGGRRAELVPGLGGLGPRTPRAQQNLPGQLPPCFKWPKNA